MRARLYFLFCLILLGWQGQWVYAQHQLEKGASLPSRKLVEHNSLLAKKQLKRDYFESVKGGEDTEDRYFEFLLQRASTPDKNQILNFKNEVDMTDHFASLAEFKEFLQDYRPQLLDADGGVRGFFGQLERMLVKIEMYQKWSLWQNLDFADFTIHEKGLTTEVKDHPYNDYLKELLALDPKLEQFKKFFKLLMNDEELFLLTPYEDETDEAYNFDCARKKFDVKNFANKITAFLKIKALYANINAFEDKGFYEDYQKFSEHRKSELLYKMILVAQKVMDHKKKSPGKIKKWYYRSVKKSPLDASLDFTPDNVAYVLTQVLHGGKHCSDAVCQVIDETLFTSLCSGEKEELLHRLYPSADHYVMCYLMANELKKEMSDKYIFDFVPMDGAESITIRAASADALAKTIGIKTKGAHYPGWADPSIVKEGFLFYYTPEKLVKRYIKTFASQMDMEAGSLTAFLGPKYKTYMAMAQLKLNGLLKLDENVSPEELEIRARYPQLTALKANELDEDTKDNYKITMLLFGLLENKPNLVQRFLNKQIYAKSLNYSREYFPFISEGDTLWDIFLQFCQSLDLDRELTLQSKEEKLQGAGEFVRIINKIHPSNKHAEYLLKRSLNNHNLLATRLILKAGFSFSKELRTYVKNNATVENIEFMKKIADLIPRSEDLLSKMRARLK